MPKFSINKFKGLKQDINYPELPLQYCHVCTNLNVDDDVGALKIRGGSVKKYNEALSGYPFTSLVSVFEYRYEVASETVLIVNDNGTLKTMTDGGAPASLSLPTGATLESGFQNYYLGYKDHVLITTGNSSTNYILWYGYVDREIDDNTALFGNVKEYTGYILTKSQLVCPHGMFSNIRSMVYINDFYYVSFLNSIYIEKRDTSFRLVERFDVHPDGATETATAGRDIVLCRPYDAEILYAVGRHQVDEVVAWKIDVDGWKLEGEYVSDSLSGVDANSNLGGACADEANLFIAITDADDGIVLKVGVTDMALDDSDLIDDILDICCDDTDNIGLYYVLEAGDISAYDKSGMVSASDTDATPVDAQYCHYDDVNDELYITDQDGDGHVFIYDGTDIAGGPDDEENVDEPKALVFTSLTTMMAVSSKYGTLEDIADVETGYPGLIGINHVSSESGKLDAGTYWYKLSLVDQDGQEYTLSDPIFVNVPVDNKVNLRVIAHADYLDELYRVEYINIYRAANTTSQDEEFPSTDYKFLKQIDINSSTWEDDEDDHELFYYDYTDDTTEDTISTTTFLESSGISDTVKPRLINGKYFTWVNDQLHLANFNHDGETYKNRILRSADNAPDALAFHDYYDFDVGVGEAINGITELNGRAIIFKDRKMGMFYDGRWEQTFEPGAHNSHAFYKVNDIIYYVSTKGIHAFDGSRLINIHYPVIDYFIQLNKDTYPPNVFYVDGKDRLYFTMRGQGVAVYNTRVKTWTWYDGNIAFYGCFKNYAEEYIGWNATTFYEFEDNTSVNDKEDYGAGNGSSIAMAYESPLIRLSSIDGEIGIPISHRHRIKKDVASGATNRVTFTLYEYQDDASGRTSRYTQYLDSPIGAYAATKSYFFGPIMGESFSTRFAATAIKGGNFEYHGITIDYMPGGYWRGR